MRKSFILLLSLNVALTSAAQSSLPPVFEIKTDTIDHLILVDGNWQMLEDKTGKLTIDQVSQLPFADRFHSNTVPAEGIHTYWFRYRLKNTMMQEAEIAIPEELASYGDIYTQNATGRWDHKMNGRYVSWSQRDGLKKFMAILYILEPGEELLIYERNEWATPDALPSNFGPSIFFVKKTTLEKYLDDEPSVLPPIIFGIFLVAAFLNLYFYTVVRERVYLYFSLTVAFESFKQFLYSTDIFFREQPVTRNYAWYICYVLSLFFFVHVVRHFLETFKYMPRWDKWLVGVSIYAPVFISLVRLNIISMDEVYRDASGHATVFLFILITFILYLRSPNKAARLKVITVSPIVFIIGIAIIPFYVLSLYKITSLPIPAFIVWLDSHYPVLELLMFEWLIIFFSVSLFRRYQQLQNQIAFEAVENERMIKEKEIERSQLIERQKIILEKTVEERTAELKHSLNELKTTQAQLIQSEKMASLGELTAGIAHEIQNPLNFVNNFSEVNSELIDELEQEIGKGNFDDVKIIAKDLKDNEQKILHHGKRADSIVKGMLQHSRASTGKKEFIDVNALVDESLRLSYHGLRAKDKDFNAEIRTDFDDSISRINILPQDISRVLHNLFNNAFYAVNEKKKQVNGTYEPKVSVCTKKLEGKISIYISDNGIGIPKNVVGKIFQPFFTTKPTGQGTGLGLSLSYDIIKAHGGEIKVQAKEGEGVEFVIELPIQ